MSPIVFRKPPVELDIDFDDLSGAELAVRESFRMKGEFGLHPDSLGVHDGLWSGAPIIDRQFKQRLIQTYKAAIGDKEARRIAAAERAARRAEEKRQLELEKKAREERRVAFRADLIKQGLRTLADLLPLYVGQMQENPEWWQRRDPRLKYKIQEAIENIVRRFPHADEVIANAVGVEFARDGWRAASRQEFRLYDHLWDRSASYARDAGRIK